MRNTSKGVRTMKSDETRTANFKILCLLNYKPLKITDPVIVQSRRQKCLNNSATKYSKSEEGVGCLQLEGAEKSLKEKNRVSALRDSGDVNRGWNRKKQTNKAEEPCRRTKSLCWKYQPAFSYLQKKRRRKVGCGHTIGLQQNALKDYW